MKKTKIYIIGCIVLGLVLTSVFAANDTDKIRAELSSATTELTGGQEVVVTLKFDEYSKIKKGINAFKATIYYNEEIFEEIVQSNFEAQNNWEELKYNPATKEFVAIKKVGSKEPEEIAQVKLKVKETATAGKTVIKMTDITTSEGEKDIEMDNTEMQVDIVAKGMLGDTDGNEKITTKDAKMVLQHIVKKITLTDDQFTRADTDRNGKITTKDAKMILQHIVKKIDLSKM